MRFEAMRRLRRRRVVVPAGEARAICLRAGELVRVVDLEGGQVGDLFAFVLDDVAECVSASHTRASLSRLQPRVGEAFVSNQRRRLLTLIEDRSPGHHDMLIAACDPARYAELGAPDSHRSCAENLRSVLADLALELAEVPQPINLFMHVPVRDGGALGWEPASTQAGDYVVLRAEVDVLLVLSACPQDLVPINGDGPTPLALERV